VVFTKVEVSTHAEVPGNVYLLLTNLYGGRKAQGYGAASLLTGSYLVLVYGRAISVDVLGRTRQLIGNGCAVAILHGGPEIGTLPIELGITGRDGVSDCTNLLTGELEMHINIRCMSGYVYIYQH
jgi:hypothetical protein